MWRLNLMWYGTWYDSQMKMSEMVTGNRGPKMPTHLC